MSRHNLLRIDLPFYRIHLPIALLQGTIKSPCIHLDALFTYYLIEIHILSERAEEAIHLNFAELLELYVVGGFMRFRGRVRPSLQKQPDVFTKAWLKS